MQPMLSALGPGALPTDSYVQRWNPGDFGSFSLCEIHRVKETYCLKSDRSKKKKREKAGVRRHLSQRPQLNKYVIDHAGSQGEAGSG